MKQADAKQLWSEKLATEENFWALIINDEVPKYKNSVKDRAAGRWPFPRSLKQYVNASGATRILDVGAGPVTVIGKDGMPPDIEVVAIDPLAESYNQKLDVHGIVPWVRTRQGEAERLPEYGLGMFDIVYARNALDHAYDPVRGIESMLSVAKQHGVVFLVGSVNEGEKHGYRGLHQWNFLPSEDGDLIIWRPELRVSMRSHLIGKAAVSASGDKWYEVHIRPV